MIWYCSFADPKRPSGTQFLGAVITEGDGGPLMVMKMHLMGVNPGGEIMMVPSSREIPAKWMDRLLTREEIDEMDRELLA